MSPVARAALIAIALCLPIGVAVGVSECRTRTRAPVAPARSRLALPTIEEDAASEAAPVPSPLPTDGATAQPDHAPALAEIAGSNRLLAEARAAGDTPRARQLYADAIRVNPRNVDALDDLAEKMLDDERWSDAQTLARHCLEVDEHRESCRATLRMSYTRSGDFDAAANEYADCLRTTPDDANCLSFWAGDAARRGDVARQRELVARLAKQQPERVDTLLLQARLALGSGDLASAQRLYDALCEKGQEFACHQARDSSARRGSDGGD